MRVTLKTRELRSGGGERGPLSLGDTPLAELSGELSGMGGDGGGRWRGEEASGGEVG